MVWPNDWINLVWPRYIIKTFKHWFKVVMLNVFQRMKLIVMTVQCVIPHTTLCSNLVRWDQFLIVQRDTREWVWMVNVCKARTWQITSSIFPCSDFDNLSTPSGPMWRVCIYKYEFPMQTGIHCVFCGMILLPDRVSNDLASLWRRLVHEYQWTCFAPCSKICQSLSSDWRHYLAIILCRRHAHIRENHIGSLWRDLHHEADF